MNIQKNMVTNKSLLIPSWKMLLSPLQVEFTLSEELQSPSTSLISLVTTARCKSLPQLMPIKEILNISRMPLKEVTLLVSLDNQEELRQVSYQSDHQIFKSYHIAYT